MKQSDESASIANVRLTRSEQRLIRELSKYRRTVFFAFVLLVAICLVWLKHFHRFMSNPFFLTYNVVVYAALIWAAFSTARYQWRVHRLLERLRRRDDSAPCSSVPDV
jgi:hypothetical protein